VRTPRLADRAGFLSDCLPDLLMTSIGRRDFLKWAAVSGLLASGCHSRPERSLIVYCAHDSLYAAPILEEFSLRKDCAMYVKYDTEASKSLGLVSRLLSEKDQPQCDVFWNNEALGTAALAAADILAELGVPQQVEEDHSRRWVSFGGRLRCVISGRKRSLEEGAVSSFLDQDDLSRCCIAKPMFGTTLTQYCAWAESWGLPTLMKRHQSWVAKGLRVVEGNAQVKDLVAAGACELGFTDTDDLFVGRDSGSELFFEPVRIGGKTICIPNTAAVIRGAARPDLAQQLVAHLSSANVELELSRSPARQIPLGVVDPVTLSDEVRALRSWAEESIDVAALLEIRSEVLQWLRREYSS